MLSSERSTCAASARAAGASRGSRVASRKFSLGPANAIDAGDGGVGRTNAAAAVRSPCCCCCCCCCRLSSLRLRRAISAAW